MRVVLFFNDPQTLTCCLYFDAWLARLTRMCRPDDVRMAANLERCQ
jgi:hypothetical protein